MLVKIKKRLVQNRLFRYAAQNKLKAAFFSFLILLTLCVAYVAFGNRYWFVVHMPEGRIERISLERKECIFPNPNDPEIESKILDLESGYWGHTDDWFAGCYFDSSPALILSFNLRCSETALACFEDLYTTAYPPPANQEQRASVGELFFWDEDEEGHKIPKLLLEDGRLLDLELGKGLIGYDETAFSPDQNWIVLSKYEPDDPIQSIYKVNLKNMSLVLLTSHDFGDLERWFGVNIKGWSPDGEWIIYRITPPGTDATRPKELEAMRWMYGFWVVGADGKNRRQLSIPLSYSCRYPVSCTLKGWLAENLLLLADEDSKVEQSWVTELYTFNIDTEELKKVQNTITRDSSSFVFDSKLTRMFFRQMLKGEPEVFMVRDLTTGSEQVLVSENDFGEYYDLLLGGPYLSPDDEWVAFVIERGTEEPGRISWVRELWLAAVPEGEVYHEDLKEQLVELSVPGYSCYPSAWASDCCDFSGWTSDSRYILVNCFTKIFLLSPESRKVYELVSGTDIRF